MSDTSPAFQFYPGDFLSDKNTALMAPEEIGAYVLLMCYCWKEGSLNDDMEEMALLSRMDEQAFKSSWEKRISSCFIMNDHGEWVHPRLEKERQKQKKWKEKSSAAGKRSARLRKARKKATHSDVEWEYVLKLVGSKCPRCGSECNNFHKDHVKPIYQGGSDGIMNIQPLCSKCNQQKGPENIDHIKDLRPKIKQWLNSGSANNQPPFNSSFSSSTSSSTSDSNTYTGQFEDFWDLYDVKKGKKKAFMEWKKLTESEKAKIMENVPIFLTHFSSKHYTPRPRKYLYNRYWEDEDYQQPKTETNNGSSKQQSGENRTERFIRRGQEVLGEFPDEDT